ncbi:hypothetical protein F442_02854 [Phytophthora nicotianae P10297]|uniref:Uncharacterized protein n=1 Tax=Phytophthora nicotianae P10297 TaxID=1317064 RepID=W2ZYR4_PHYNI|nr:hypothetical protein F442_02854 [Phytophthora nicotianae P10297]
MNQPPVLLIETRYLDLQFLNTVLEGNRVDTALLGIGLDISSTLSKKQEASIVVSICTVMVVIFGSSGSSSYYPHHCHDSFGGVDRLLVVEPRSGQSANSKVLFITITLIFQTSKT